MRMWKRFASLLLSLLLIAALLSVAVSATEYDGGAYDEYESTESGADAEDILVRVLIGVGIGLAVGLVTVLLMRRSMNTVRKQKNATVYTEKDSFALTESRDIYLYSRVTRTRVQSDRDRR